MTHTTHVQRTAVVTGAARGIGTVVARRLAGEGLAVGVIDLDEAECGDTVDTITGVGGAALAVAADAVNEAAVAAPRARIAAAFGPPTVLIDNTCIGPLAGLEEMTTQQWDTVWANNSAARSSPPDMSSIAAGDDAGRVDYASTKATLIGIAKSCALRLARHGVAANAIAPGFIVSVLVSPGAGSASGQVMHVAGGRWTEG
ncbi:SDR family NAD(P)-dependent oxidoreductase [Streptomyces sp. YS-3]|uniref:SDR family NAD(P)-dependent oxidoreductase n=1 Tax=Streptomyces sp. YS-3 TaxID=3381352 RepID=UPI003862A19D